MWILVEYLRRSGYERAPKLNNALLNESTNEALSACMHAEQNRIDHASADTTSADTGRFVFRFRLEKPLLALPLVYLHF